MDSEEKYIKKYLEEIEQKIKNSFVKIREDINNIKQEIAKIKQEIWQISASNTLLMDSAHVPAHTQQFGTQTQIKQGIKPQKVISIGNRGVPADSQQTFGTSQETLQLRDLFRLRQKQEKTILKTSFPLTSKEIKRIVDSMAQELKNKFEKLSKQEFYIFSVIYNLDLNRIPVDYKTISLKTGLTESSVRDYISRLIHKGIPIKKNKINNKNIIISVPEELKNIAIFTI